MDFDFKNEFYATRGDDLYLVADGVVLDKEYGVGSRGKRGLVHNVGVNDWKYSVGNRGSMSLAYSVWSGILQRCYSKQQETKYPSYRGCTVSEDWKSFSSFLHFYLPLAKIDWQVDKDILICGNKLYSSETCLLVPAWVNTLTLNRASRKGVLPQGICLNKKNYQVQCSFGKSKPEYLGTYKNLDNALEVYARAKQNHIESMRVELDAVGRHNNLGGSLCDIILSNLQRSIKN